MAAGVIMVNILHFQFQINLQFIIMLQTNFTLYMKEILGEMVYPASHMMTHT